MGRVDHVAVYVKRSFKAAMVLAAAVSMAAVSQRVGAADPAAGAGTEKKVDFTKDIQPILKDSCIRCHKAPEARGRGPGGPGGGGSRGGPGGSRGGGPRRA